MSIKLADTLAPMGDFPAVESDNVDITINGSPKSLQQAYEDGDLGAGGSSIQVDQMPAASATELGKVYQFIGASGTYQHNYFYECVSDGETPPTYSWEQKNVQPSNAQASQVSYDNTTSGMTADDVQEAIDEIHSGLGTAAGKDFTDNVRPNSHDLVESGSVYSAINNALSTIYVPRGALTCAELTSALLVEANVGNVYEMSDSGTTSALFINGAGKTISVGDNVGIIKAGADTYLFNYMGNAFDLTDYQKKDLSSPIAGASTVEGAIAQNTSDIEKIKAYTAVSNTDANTIITTGLYYLTTGCTNIPSAYCILQVQSKNTTSISDDIAQYTVNTEGDQYYRVRVNGTWSSWRKLATSDNMTSLLKNKMSCYTWETDKTLKAVFYEITDRGILSDVTDAVGKRIIARYGNVLINRITQVNGVKNLYWDDTLVLSCPWNDDTTKLTDVLEIFVGTTAWRKFVTTDDIFHVGDRRNTIGWADLSNTVNIDGSSNYANNIGRIEGHNAIIEVSNPNIGYQWPVTNSGNRNEFIDFGSSLQFFIDKVNNHLYVRFSDSVDMSNWGEIVTQNDMNTYAKPHIYNLSGGAYPTLQTFFDELVTRLKADAVGNDYGICFMGTWAGKSFFEGSFYTVDGHSSYFKITFQNPQDSKSLYTGYTGYSDTQVTYTGVA